MATLDNILSGDGEAAPEPAAITAPVEAPAPADEQTAEPETEGVTESPDGRKMVPLEALTESRSKVKRYTEEVADFRKQMQESNAAWERRMAELVEAVKPKQEPQQAPDFYAEPEVATRHVMAPEFERVNQTLMANAQLIAGIKYGDDKVSDAEQAFISAVQAKTLDPADYHRVVNSPNRYAAAVQWHQRQLAQQEIGDDPAAFRAKVEAEILAKHGLTPGATPTAPAATTAPVMPSNLANARNVGARSGPAWSGPTPLGDIFNRAPVSR